MLWAKLLLPVLMVTGGTGFAVAAYVGDSAATAGPSRVWIDAPDADRAVAPGQVVVTAHATAEQSIAALDLYVDDQKVATDSALRTTDKLVFARFRWDAKATGEHQLVVRQVGGSEERSDPLFVTVGTEPSETDAPAPTVNTVPADTSTTTTLTTPPTSSTTTSEVPTVPGDPGTTSPGPSPTNPTATAPPNTTPPPVASVFIDSAALGTNVSSCLPVSVTAGIRGADYASAVIRGTKAEVDMSFENGVWRGTIAGNALFEGKDVGTHQVTVLAGRGDEVVKRDAGEITVKFLCKD